MNICSHFSSVDTYERTGSVIQYIYIYIFNFLKKLPNCFPKWLYNFTLPPAVYETPSWSTFSFMLRMVILFNFSQSGKCWMITHGGFNLHFLNDKWWWTSFYVVICHPYNDGAHLLMWVSAIHIFVLHIFVHFAHFKLHCFLIIKFWIFLNNVDTNPLSGMWFAKSHSFVFLIHHILNIISQKSWPNMRS